MCICIHVCKSVCVYECVRTGGHMFMYVSMRYFPPVYYSSYSYASAA